MPQKSERIRREMAEYIKEWTTDTDGSPLSDSDALEIVDNLIGIITDNL